VTVEFLSKPDVPFRALSEREKEHVMTRVRALISNGYMRPCLFAFGVSKLEQQILIMRDRGILKIEKDGGVSMYDFKNCRYTPVEVQIGGRRPRRKS